MATHRARIDDGRIARPNISKTPPKKVRMLKKSKVVYVLFLLLLPLPRSFGCSLFKSDFFPTHTQTRTKKTPSTYPSSNGGDRRWYMHKNALNFVENLCLECVILGET